jgi:hypothetical protein
MRNSTDMTKNYLALLEAEKQRLLKALSHLAYSYEKVQVLPTDPKQLGEEALETWESYTRSYTFSFEHETEYFCSPFDIVFL